MVMPARVESYSYGFGEGQRAIIAFDVDAALEEQHQRLPHCRRVIVRLPPQRCLPTGLPRGELLEPLERLEHSLDEALTGAGLECLQVGRMLYHGLCEFVYQVEGPQAFEGVVDVWQSRHPGWTFDRRASDGWSFFDEKVRPDPWRWRLVADGKVVAQLLRAGSDPHQPHVLEHHIRGPAPVLQAITQELNQHGFEGIATGGETLTLLQTMPLDVDQISRTTVSLASYCRDLGAEYDGWGAAVVRRPAPGAGSEEAP
jgi:hypothetical protein